MYLAGTAASLATYNLEGGTLTTEMECLGPRGTARFNQTGGSNLMGEGGLSISALEEEASSVYALSGGLLSASYLYVTAEAGGQAALEWTGGSLGTAQVGILGTGRIRVDCGGSAALVTTLLFIEEDEEEVPTGRLDLTENNLVVDYAEGQSPLVQVCNWIRAGYNRGAGYWDGPGITSTAAAEDPDALTALGVIDNSDPLGDGLVGGLTELEGVSVDLTSVLVKYTYWGDMNFDGQVTFDDYDVIDYYYWFPPENEDDFGWWCGDLDYDKNIDFDDYDLIDYAWWFQNGPLKAGGGGGEEEAQAAEGEATEAAEGGCPTTEAAEGGCPTTDEAEKAAAWAATDDPERAARHAKIRALLGWERTGPGRPPPRPEAETKE